MDRYGVPLQLVAEVEISWDLRKVAILFHFLLAYGLWFSLLHHTFLWQNSADWQGMNDARCFGTDPCLPACLPPYLPPSSPAAARRFQ